MGRLGISIYPGNRGIEEDKAYISLAAKYGFKRIFSCLISAVEKDNVATIKKDLTEVIAHAHANGMEIILDVAPSVFPKLGISYDDLSFFHEIGADGIRLDEGFDGHREAMLSHNPYGMQIEVNASLGTKYLENILSYGGNRSKLVSCHNFYPQRYTALSFAHFEKCSKALKEERIQVAAFVSSQAENTFGPWPVNEGLCTLEEHRNLPIDVQARHLFATGLVDDVIIGNAYATEEELISLSKVKPNVLSFKIAYEVEPSEVETKIIYEHPHYVRGDMSEYMGRSTFPRITFKDADIPAKNTRDVKRGDIVILNNEYGRYKGEIHIILKDMPNEGNKNVIGHIPTDEMMLLDYVNPWVVFEFIR